MKLISPSLFLLTCFVMGGVFFKLSAPRQCVNILNNDNIFVLTGDFRRIPFAMRQMHMHPYAKLYIIGAGADWETNYSKKVKIESNSKSTYQNALAIKKIVQEQNLDRIVIITTEEHMNRALLLIKQELPQNTVLACPVKLSDMPVAKRLERWFIEYVKYLVTLLGIKEG